MKRILLVLFGLVALVSGCVTSITVTKVSPANPNPEGERIYLPATFLVGRYPTNFSTTISATDITNFDALAIALNDGSDISRFVTNQPSNNLTADLFAYTNLKNLSNGLAAELAPTVDAVQLSDLIQNASTVNTNGIPKAWFDPKTPPATEAEKATMKRLLLTAAFPQTLSIVGNKVTPDSFSDLNGFIYQLGWPTNAISMLIFNQLAQQAQTDVKAYIKDATQVQELHTLIVPALNNVINGPRVDPNLVTKRIQKFNRSLSPQTLSLADAKRLNRWLLYDAYSAGLANPEEVPSSSNEGYDFSTDDIENIDALAAALDDGSDISQFVTSQPASNLASDLSAYKDLNKLLNGMAAELVPTVDAVPLSELITNAPSVNIGDIPKAWFDPKTPPTTDAEKATMKRLLLTAAFSQTLDIVGNQLKINNLDGFIHELAKPTNAIAALVFNQLTPKAQADVGAYINDSTQVEGLNSDIVTTLNTIITSGQIVDPNLVMKRIQNLNPPGSFSPQTQNLITKTIPRLNRWLLYDAYSDSLDSPAVLITYDTEMLPDPDQEYAISAQSYFAKQTVGIHRTPEGYLKELDLNQDSTAVAEAVIAGAGQYAAARFSSAQGNNPSSNSGSTNTTTTTTTTSSGGSGGGGSGGGGSGGGGSGGGGSGGGGSGGGGNQGTNTQTTTTTTVVSQPSVLSGPIAVVYSIQDSPRPKTAFDAALFSNDNLIDVPQLVQRLSQAPPPSFENDIYTFLKTQNPHYPLPANPLNKQLDYMRNGLNDLLTHGILCDSKDFDSVKSQLSDETKALITQYYQAKMSATQRRGGYLDPLLAIRVNRMVLEDIFPEMIAEASGLKLKLVDFQIFSYYDGTNRMAPPTTTLSGLLQQGK